MLPHTPGIMWIQDRRRQGRVVTDGIQAIAHGPLRDSVALMTRVLVTGTTRPTGQAVLARLAQHGFETAAAVGDPAGRIVALDHSTVAANELAIDFDTHTNMVSALEGASTLIHAADIRPGGSESIIDSASAIASACAECNVHLVLLSRVGADQSSLEHRRHLWQAELLLEAIEGLKYTIQRITHPHPALAALMSGPWLPLPGSTPVQPVSPSDVAGRVVGLVQVGASARVKDFGGPELMRFSEACHIYRQVHSTLPRRVPVPHIGVIGEAVNGVHVSQTGDRGHETFRWWLKANKS